MDGLHDFAGKQGYGRVDHMADQDIGKTFKADWEPLGYALIFLGVEKGFFSIDEVRHAVERIEPRQHMQTSYYERYVIGVASLLVEKGVLTHEELESAAGGRFKLARPAISGGRPAPNIETAFKVGDRVRVKDEPAPFHVRYPAYCRGKVGIVTHRTTEAWPFPDSIGHGRPDHGSENTLHVEFKGSELFGNDTDAGAVVVDLFEGYLEAA